MSERIAKPEIEGRLRVLESMNADDPSQLKSVLAEANSIRDALLKEAKARTVLGRTEKLAGKLTSIMFNRFHTTEFDNLLEELIAVSPSPIEPMRSNPNE